VAQPVTDDVDRLRRDYAPVFLKYLARQDETGLEAAYELGRDAMRRSIGLLEVVRVHNEAYLDVVATVRDVEEAHQVAQSASTFLLELIAAFEMAQRGFMEGRQRQSAPDSRPPGG
jgi:Phosphoserine phosphatase RsbU, N-terminal domain